VLTFLVAVAAAEDEVFVEEATMTVDERTELTTADERTELTIVDERTTVDERTELTTGAELAPVQVPALDWHPVPQ
jgi:hypothetical protein